MLSPEQISEIKKQLFQQLESWPDSQRAEAKKQIESMDNQQLEEFLAKNNMIKTQEPQQPAQPQQNPFRLIVQGKIPSYKIDENAKAIAVLEINPISKGHSIIIPKQPCTSEKIPNQVLTLAKKIAKKIKTKLKPENVEISTSEVFNESIVNIIPIYKGEKPSERKKADEKELEKLQKKLEKKQTAKRPKKIQIKKLEKAPIRIP